MISLFFFSPLVFLIFITHSHPFKSSSPTNFLDALTSRKSGEAMHAKCAKCELIGWVVPRKGGVTGTRNNK